MAERVGLPEFFALLNEMAELHERKSHDYASKEKPVGNYHFAGELALLFKHSAQDAGFIGRIGEKLYRLSNLEANSKTPRNESIEDTERDICVITCLWMADRRDRRNRVSFTIDNIGTEQENIQNMIISLETKMSLETKRQIISYLQACLRDK